MEVKIDIENNHVARLIMDIEYPCSISGMHVTRSNHIVVIFLNQVNVYSKDFKLVQCVIVEDIGEHLTVCDSVVQGNLLVLAVGGHLGVIYTKHLG